MGPAGEHCKLCYFFEKTIEDHCYPGAGYCMRFPPVDRLSDANKIAFQNKPWDLTVVDEEYWCGEFRAQNLED